MRFVKNLILTIILGTIIVGCGIPSAQVITDAVQENVLSEPTQSEEITLSEQVQDEENVLSEPVQSEKIALSEQAQKYLDIWEALKIEMVEYLPEDISSEIISTWLETNSDKSISELEEELLSDEFVLMLATVRHSINKVKNAPVIPAAAKLWDLRYYVDNFNQPTDKAYITNQIVSGVFSNTATRNSDLEARIIIDEHGLDIILWEYARNRVTNGSARTHVDYNISIRTSSGDDYRINGSFMGISGDRIHVPNAAAITNALMESDSVIFYIENADRPTTNYLFTVESANFKDVYAQFIGN